MCSTFVQVEQFTVSNLLRNEVLVKSDGRWCWVNELVCEGFVSESSLIQECGITQDNGSAFIERYYWSDHLSKTKVIVIDSGKTLECIGDLNIVNDFVNLGSLTHTLSH